MSANKTQPGDRDVSAFLEAVEPERKRLDALRLMSLFEEVTGFAPRMWGASIVGYGRYHYRTQAGREGDYLATGFSPRKAAISVYVMPGYTDFSGILARLGKHKHGKSCLYINKLADIDERVLAELISAGLKDLGRSYDILPE